MKIGIIAGAFDVLHLGYIEMFMEAKEKCDLLTILLHADPTNENKNKLKPIQTPYERVRILSSIKYIDNIITYHTEQELFDIIKNYVETNGDVIRFLGDDYIGKPFTGDSLKTQIHYFNRDHGWSTTKYKELIKNSFDEKRKAYN
jgi:glycerol-3-phosphate cytidylyltransferase